MSGDAEVGLTSASEPIVASDALDGEPADEPRISAERWRQIRLAVAVVYLAVVAWIVVEYGVPTGRQMIASLIVTALLITRIGQGWRRIGLVFVDWLPFTLVLILYDRSRGLAVAIGMPLHEADAVTWERWFCGGVIPTAWLQHHLYNPHHVYWYDAAMTLVYTSHFIATPVIAAALWLKERAQWIRFVSRIIVLSVAGLITYTLLPEAPPWLASQDGYIHGPRIERLSARGWEWLHLGDLKLLLANAQDKGSNPVAAMPSLHTAFATLIAIFIASRLHSRWRYLLALYPLAMGFSLVYLGEHYVIDLVAGIAYALLAHVGMTRFEHYWKRRKSANAAKSRQMSDLVLVSTEVTGVDAGASGTEMAR